MSPSGMVSPLKIYSAFVVKNWPLSFLVDILGCNWIYIQFVKY
jgi:hypothetical protein